jgi:ABC-2 type transport system permease protein
LKTLATIYKEFLLLIRDPGGMALILLMPLALLVVMALVQDGPFKDYQEIKLDVLIADFDNDSLSAKIRKAFHASPNINLVENNDTAEVKRMVSVGEYKAAIVIPSNATIELRRKSKQIIEEIFANFGLIDEQDSLKRSDAPPIGIKIIFDPAIKVNYQQTLSGGLEKIIAGVQSEWLLDEMQNKLSEGSEKKKIKLELDQMMKVHQDFASENKYQDVIMNSVQHNVPAWTMFGMFFILYPLAGNFIRERADGSLHRLRLISGSQFPVISGKFAFYFLVCLLQFLLMTAVGVFLMPLLGLDRLALGNNLLGIAITACAVAMAATGYGLLIAVYFKTAQQALSFGSISVVILSALGGVWVPVYVMPQSLQIISRFSPLNWGLESFNDLFLRDAPMSVIMPQLLKLSGFGVTMLLLSIWIHKSRTISSN